MGDLGDLGGFLKSGGVSDLSWLDVDDKEYRNLDTLPKQNLDISPDLQALWGHEDRSPSSYLVPNKDIPRTMGDLSEAHGKLAHELRVAARLSLYSNHTDLNRWKESLTSKFGLEILREHRDILKEALEDRGLLGGVYVDSQDFPNCHRANKSAQELVHRLAPEAGYVKAKPACQNCRYATMTPSGGQNCAVFHKELVLDIPYTDALADQIESRQGAHGKVVQANTELLPKERIRLAILSPRATKENLSQVKPVENTARLMGPSGKVHLRIVRSASMPKEASDVLGLLRREFLRGRSPSEALSTLKIAYPLETLKDTRQHWEPTFKEAGLFGAIYMTQDSFQECRDGVDFLAKHASQVRGIVAGQKCGGCYYNKMSRCMMYGKPLVKEASELYTEDTVREVIREHRLAGRLETGSDTITWGDTPESSLREIHRVASMVPQTQAQHQRVVMKAFVGNSFTQTTSALTKREVVRTASRYLNEGLYGQDLMELMRKRFDPRDITAASEGLREVLAEQGLQGIKYIDPTVYTDYGKGCNEAERLHRSRLVPYVKMASSCTSCVHQTKSGYCSKLNKPLVPEVPYLDKQAEQREILASGRSTHVSYADLMNNGLSMMAEYEMQNRQAEVELDPTPAPSFGIELGQAGQKVKF